MGRQSLEHYFHHRYRDPLAVGSFENDRADFKNEPYLYPKLELRYLATTLKVEVPGRLHEAMMDCLAAAEVYRKMIFRT
jgi:DNA polymerase III epsilon subunit-like protein